VGGEGIEDCNASESDVHARTRGLVTRLAGAHGEGDVLLLAAHQTTVHSLLHQASGIPMACLNVPMGSLLELRWRDVVEYGAK